MKLVSVVLSMFIVLFTIAITSCDSASGTGSPDTSGSCINCSPFDATLGDNNSQTHEDSEDPTGDDTIHVDTVDPLADYYWLEGQWQDQIELVYDITVTGWDDEKGAQVEGFSPCSQGWAIKIGDGSQLLFSGQSETGKSKCSDGKIDVINKKNVFTAVFSDEAPIIFTYSKL